MGETIHCRFNVISNNGVEVNKTVEKQFKDCVSRDGMVVTNIVISPDLKPYISKIMDICDECNEELKNKLSLAISQKDIKPKSLEVHYFISAHRSYSCVSFPLFTDQYDYDVHDLRVAINHAMDERKNGEIVMLVMNQQTRNVLYMAEILDDYSDVDVSYYMNTPIAICNSSIFELGDIEVMVQSKE